MSDPWWWPRFRMNIGVGSETKPFPTKASDVEIKTMDDFKRATKPAADKPEPDEVCREIDEARIKYPEPNPPAQVGGEFSDDNLECKSCGTGPIYTDYCNACRRPAGSDIESADKILFQYSQPGSLIDNGNLYFAATEFKSAYDAKIAELQSAVSSLEQMRTEMERVVKERDDWVEIATNEGMIHTNKQLRETVTRLEGELKVKDIHFKNAHENWIEIRGEAERLERELAEATQWREKWADRAHLSNEQVEKLRAENEELTDSRNKEYISYQEQLHAARYTISETQGALNRANEEIAEFKKHDNRLDLTLKVVKLQEQLTVALAEVERLKGELISERELTNAVTFAGQAHLKSLDQALERVRELETQLVVEDLSATFDKVAMIERYPGVKDLVERVASLEKALEKCKALTSQWVCAEATVNCKHTYDDIKATAREALGKK